MQKNETNKKLAFRIITSILLLGMFGFLFVPSVMLTTKTIKTKNTTKVSSAFSGIEIINGAIFMKEQPLGESDSDDAFTTDSKGVAYFRDNGESKGVSGKALTVSLGFFVWAAAFVAVVAGILNFFTINTKWQKFNKIANELIEYLIVVSMICAVVSFVLSFFWVAGEYGNGLSGSLAIRTNLHSYGFVGSIGQIVLSTLAFVFFRDRKIKE